VHRIKNHQLLPHQRSDAFERNDLLNRMNHLIALTKKSASGNDVCTTRLLKKRARERERKRLSSATVQVRRFWLPSNDTPEEIRDFEISVVQRIAQARCVTTRAVSVRLPARRPRRNCHTQEAQDTRLLGILGASTRGRVGRDPRRRRVSRDTNSGERSGRRGHVTWGTRQGTRSAKTPPRSSASHKENGVL